MTSTTRISIPINEHGQLDVEAMHRRNELTLTVDIMVTWIPQLREWRWTITYTPPAHWQPDAYGLKMGAPVIDTHTMRGRRTRRSEMKARRLAETNGVANVVRSAIGLYAHEFWP